MVKKETQAIAVILTVLALGLIFVGYRTIALETRVKELDWLIVRADVMIDNGTENVTHTVYLTRGGTALEALRRIAVVETRYFVGIGEYIVSIDGLREDPAAGRYWMWYLWYENEAAWRYAPVGAGNYTLEDGDRVRFSYEVPAW